MSGFSLAISYFRPPPALLKFIATVSAMEQRSPDALIVWRYNKRREGKWKVHIACSLTRLKSRSQVRCKFDGMRYEYRIKTWSSLLYDRLFVRHHSHENSKYCDYNVYVLVANRHYGLHDSHLKATSFIGICYSSFIPTPCLRNIRILNSFKDDILPRCLSYTFEHKRITQCFVYL